ncbi:hypothetical protein HUB98_12165 [Paenibacillus barcinonensis]|uniref:Uncharacterized protein n=1 Tax=Paenibacillus barcinonensis TaxID=198119 RepID=A0A2V4VWF3_PAEBA|nr:hypothetical protein [Paenibacillus barcinonensis]PYE43195.1 hypothetical protein DFQ00_1303 [Paenibacillus barcinonensis]QKS57007.1 hypothetical protein HUB98_12165 [Paenibacillus barcinonensis]
MNRVYNLDKFRKLVLWKDEFPLMPFQSEIEHELETELQLSEAIVSNNKKLALELKLPRNSSYYALLGAEYIPNQTSKLKITVKHRNNSDVLYNSKLGLNEAIYAGISTEYAQSILSNAEDRIVESNWKFAGSIAFVIGAHSVVGSSEVVFSKVVNILLALLSNELSLNSSLSDDYLINEELDK